jgi:hypothetical protein
LIATVGKIAISSVVIITPKIATAVIGINACSVSINIIVIIIYINVSVPVIIIAIVTIVPVTVPCIGRAINMRSPPASTTVSIIAVTITTAKS